jgi:branched-chain amino acid transport system permease protein
MRATRAGRVNELVFFVNKVLVAGTVIGSVYAMGAIGVTLVFGILRFAHFAHGDLMTVGAFAALACAAGWRALEIATPLPSGFIVMPVACLLTAALAIGLDRLFYKPLRDRGVVPVVLVMASIGVTLMLQGITRLFAGTSARSFFAEEPKDIFQLALPFDLARRKIVVTEPQLLLVVFTAVAVVALHLFLTRSRLGKAMRAMSDNPDLARMSGINVELVTWTTWVIAGALAAAAGTLLSLDVALKPDLSFSLLLPIFAAAIVGGVGQPYGAVAGGFLVGFAETLSVFNWSVLLRPLNSMLSGALEVPARVSFVPTEYKIVVPFFLLVAVLIWRPTGIFRGRVL